MTREDNYPYIDKRLKRGWDKIKDGKLYQKDDDRCFAVDGRERCLTGDTQIQISRYKLSRRYSLQTLYNHYRGIKNRGKLFDLSEPSKVRSFNGKEIRLHKINDVVYSGVMKVYQLTLENGYTIKATADHKIMTNNGFIELQNLKRGNQLIMCDTLKAESKNRKRIKLYDIALKVGNNHPYSNKAGRVAVHILTYEANINGLEFTKYLDILLNEKEECKRLQFVDSSVYDIHHIDGNHYNNSITNLKLLRKEEHRNIPNNYSNFSQGIPKFSRVKSVEYVGEEKTYDIICDEPHHNFVANGIVVHNSGKSLWAIQQAGYIDPEFIQRFMNDEPSICFTAEETLNAIKVLKSDEKTTRCIIFDEAFRGLSSRAVLSKVNKIIVQALMEMGQKNLVLFIVLPSFFQLDSYPAMLRSNALIHIERPRESSKTNGRIFKVYNYKKKAWLYQRGKVAWNYPVGTNFKGKFYGKYPGGEEFEKKYRKIKHEQLQKLETSLIKKSELGILARRYITQRNILMKLLFETLLLSKPKFLKLMNERGFEITASGLQHLLINPHDAEKSIEPAKTP